MRIALIGDLQYWEKEEQNFEHKLSALRELCPDHAYMLGDFGGRYMRKAEGYAETKELLSRLNCPVTVIHGNHDVEFGRDNYNSYDPAALLWDCFGLETNRAQIMNGVLFLSLSCEPQPLSGMRSIYSTYQSDKSFEWVKNQLELNKNIPAVLITHAPLAGCGIRREPPMHPAAGDTYIEQTFNPLRWHELLKSHSNIKAWVSAHLHMAHDYNRAISSYLGCVHISCGTMTGCSRDDKYHTRLLDIKEKSISVYSYDHITDTLIYDAEIDLVGNDHKGKIYTAQLREILLGQDKPISVWQDLDRCYISTEAGLLWEYEEAYNDISGALVREGTLKEISADKERIYIRTETELFSVEKFSRGRWDIQGAFTDPERRKEKEMRGKPLLKIPYRLYPEKEGNYIMF